MAERAHPDDPGFQNRWKFGWRRGLVPWLQCERTPWRAEFDWRYKWAGKFCSGRDVLDIPCGMGWGTSLLPRCRSLLGMDISEEAIAEAQQRYRGRPEFRLGSMEKIDCADGSLDVVCCLEGIEHVSVDAGQMFLKEAHRVLREDGLLLISSPSCPNGQHSGNPHHVHEYRPDEIARLIGERFEIQEKVERPVSTTVVSYICARKTRS